MDMDEHAHLKTMLAFMDRHFVLVLTTMSMLLIIVPVGLAFGIALLLNPSIQSATRAAAAEPQPAPLKYTSNEFAARVTALCPGSTLEYTPTLTVAHTGAIDRRLLWWNETTRSQAVDLHGVPVPAVDIPGGAPESIAGDRREKHQTARVPDMPPADYSLVVFVWDVVGRGQTQYRVPVTVPTGCGGT